MIIIDTSIISELQKLNPNANVVNWLDQQEQTNLYLTSITAAERLLGANGFPCGKRADDLRNSVAHLTKDQFRGSKLPLRQIQANDRYEPIAAVRQQKNITILYVHCPIVTLRETKKSWANGRGFCKVLNDREKTI